MSAFSRDNPFNQYKTQLNESCVYRHVGQIRAYGNGCAYVHDVRIRGNLLPVSERPTRRKRIGRGGSGQGFGWQDEADAV